MISRTAACLSGVLGGICWIARYALTTTNLIDIDGTLSVVLLWAGATWLLLALASAGVSLVRRAPLWLRIVLGVAVPMLALVFLSLGYDALGPDLAKAIFGAVILLGSLVILRRPPRRRAVTEEKAGAAEKAP